MTRGKYKNIPNCLRDYLLVDTTSLDYARDVASRSFVPHTLEKKGADVPFHFLHSHAFLENVSLSYTSYGSQICLEPEVLNDFYLIQIPVHGEIEVQTKSEHCLSQGMMASIVSATEHTKMHWQQNAGLQTVKVNREALEQQLQKMIPEEVRAPIVFDIQMPLYEHKFNQWRIAVYRLMQHFQQVENTELVSLERSFENHLLETLLTSQHNNYSEIINRVESGALTKPVDIAIDYMHANYANKITLEDLAKVSNVTARTLHNGFKKYRNQSPFEYLLNLRLDKARKLLSKGGHDENVTNIAHSTGFRHLGRFSNNYATKFGELPSQTIST